MAETQLGTVVGTVSYMSPEQALGKRVDHRSDLFSFGVVLYEALTSRLPFEGETLAAVVDQILRHEPPALARLNYDVPARLQDIVRKLLAKAPSSRYQSARDLLIDVKALRKDLERESQVDAGLRLSSVDRVLADASPGPADNVVAVIPFINITGEPADDWIGAGIAETVTADLKSISGLTVIGRERVFDAIRRLGSSAAGELDDLVWRDVGRQLRATWLVSGGYQRLGEVIRITARGVEVETGTVIRSVKIDGAISEIFALQDKIVYELSQGMNLTLHDSEVAEIERNETESVEAYEARSRAMMNLLEASPQALDRAISLLEKATQQDPNYASAWAALGAAYDLKGSFQSLPAISAKAIETERRAIAINPGLADAHRWLGLSLLTLERYDEAIEAIKEAARLEPGDANVYLALGPGLLDREGATGRGHHLSRTGSRHQSRARLRPPPTRLAVRPAWRLRQGGGVLSASDRDAGAVRVGPRGSPDRRCLHQTGLRPLFAETVCGCAGGVRAAGHGARVLGACTQGTEPDRAERQDRRYLPTHGPDRRSRHPFRPSVGGVRTPSGSGRG